MRAPLRPADGDHYQRPRHAWACGLVEDGRACPVGPDDRGHCPAASACHPLREGDRWLCNRSPLRGGPCPPGPDPEGTCAHVFRCAPVRSLRSRRGQLAGNQSLWSWLGAGATSRTAVQSELCLACHDRQIPVKFALAAHTTGHPLTAEGGAANGDKPHRRRDPQSPIACAACHREHQGTLHDLSAIDNPTCQACHRQSIASFADDHPDFENWPYAVRSPIQFDHGRHEGKHFPQSRKEFDCAACHVPGADGQRQATLGYDAACAACHDALIERSWSGGGALLKLPELDVELLAEEAQFASPWPMEATGDFDGGLPEMNRLLLAADPAAAEALATFGTNFNAFDVDPDDPAQLKALAVVATAQRTLIENLTLHAEETIGARLSTVLGRQLSSRELTDLVGGMAPDALQAYSGQWFDDRPDANRSESRAARDSQGAAPHAAPHAPPPRRLGPRGGGGRLCLSPARTRRPLASRMDRRRRRGDWGTTSYVGFLAVERIAATDGPRAVRELSPSGSQRNGLVPHQLGLRCAARKTGPTRFGRADSGPTGFGTTDSGTADSDTADSGTADTGQPDVF